MITLGVFSGLAFFPKKNLGSHTWVKMGSAAIDVLRIVASDLNPIYLSILNYLIFEFSVSHFLTKSLNVSIKRNFYSM